MRKADAAWGNVERFLSAKVANRLREIESSLIEERSKADGPGGRPTWEQIRAIFVLSPSACQDRVAEIISGQGPPINLPPLPKEHPLYVKIRHSITSIFNTVNLEVMKSQAADTAPIAPAPAAVNTGEGGSRESDAPQGRRSPRPMSKRRIWQMIADGLQSADAASEMVVHELKGARNAAAGVQVKMAKFTSDIIGHTQKLMTIVEHERSANKERLKFICKEYGLTPAPSIICRLLNPIKRFQ